MRDIFIFAVGLLFTFIFLFQIRHFIKDEGESLYGALMKSESIMYGIIGLTAWIAFIVYAFY